MHNDLLSRIEKKITRTINQKHAYDFDGTGIGWNKFENNPVLSDEHGGSLFDPFVRRINGKYMMGVSNRRTKSVELYESIEGTLWKKIGVAITGIPTSEWEKDVNRACFLHRNSRWYLWYTGQSEGKSYIGLATSADGRKYDRYEINPVIKPELEFEKKSVMNPCVMYDDCSNMFKMWYAAGESYEPDVIAYAESIDGIHWKKNPIPVMSSNADFLYQKAKVGACDVVRMKDGRYCMAYIAYQNINVARICLAYSDDGISNWIYSKSNPILSPERGKWDSHAVYKPSIVLDEENNKFLLWYNGRTNHCEQIGMAMGEQNDTVFARL